LEKFLDLDQVFESSDALLNLVLNVCLSLELYASGFAIANELGFIPGINIFSCALFTTPPYQISEYLPKIISSQHHPDSVLIFKACYDKLPTASHKAQMYPILSVPVQIQLDLFLNRPEIHIRNELKPLPK
jgi:hypothetical protein